MAALPSGWGARCDHLPSCHGAVGQFQRPRALDLGPPVPTKVTHACRSMTNWRSKAPRLSVAFKTARDRLQGVVYARVCTAGPENGRAHTCRPASPVGLPVHLVGTQGSRPNGPLPVPPFRSYPNTDNPPSSTGLLYSPARLLVRIPAPIMPKTAVTWVTVPKLSHVALASPARAVSSPEDTQVTPQGFSRPRPARGG